MAKNWTRDEERELVNLRVSDNKGWYEIADILERSADSVRMKWRNTFGETGKFSDPEQIGERVPRIGIFDVETLPMKVYAWSLWDKYTGPEQVIEESCFLSWAGKFLNDPTIHSDCLTSEESKNRDGLRIAVSCWEFIEQCDILIGHNLHKFDMRVVNTFFLKADLPPLRPLLIDTLKVVKNNFRFSSNKMGAVNNALNIKTKIENEGFRLWKKCDEGDQEALDTMLEYNVGDILALEDLFYIIRPYITNQKFNYNLYSELNETLCPVCGEREFKFNGHYYTSSGKWESLRCMSCKTLFRSKENLLGKDKKKSRVVPDT